MVTLSPAAKPLAKARQRTKALALSGLLIALSWIFLRLATQLPSAKLSLRLLAAFFLLVTASRLSLAYAWAVFFCTGFLSSLSSGFLAQGSYLLYLGPYVLLVLSMRRFKLSFNGQLASRLLLGTGLFSLMILLYGKAAFDPRLLALAGAYFYPLMLLAGLLFTVLYDYVLHLLHGLYLTRIAAHLDA